VFFFFDYFFWVSVSSQIFFSGFQEQQPRNLPREVGISFGFFGIMLSLVHDHLASFPFSKDDSCSFAQ